jgi:hypothetical protein
MNEATHEYSDHYAEWEQQSTEWSIEITNSASEHTWKTVDNFEKYDYVINILLLIESKCSNKENRRWLERHAGGGRETIILFVVA